MKDFDLPVVTEYVYLHSVYTVPLTTLACFSEIYRTKKDPFFEIMKALDLPVVSGYVYTHSVYTVPSTR